MLKREQLMLFYPSCSNHYQFLPFCPCPYQFYPCCSNPTGSCSSLVPPHSQRSNLLKAYSCTQYILYLCFSMSHRAYITWSLPVFLFPCPFSYHVPHWAPANTSFLVGFRTCQAHLRFWVFLLTLSSSGSTVLILFHII